MKLSNDKRKMLEFEGKYTGRVNIVVKYSV
jgi:hypothetical protein